MESLHRRPLAHGPYNAPGRAASGEYDAAKARSEEVAQSVWLTRDEIRQYLESGKMIETLEYFFDKIDIEGS